MGQTARFSFHPDRRPDILRRLEDVTTYPSWKPGVDRIISLQRRNSRNQMIWEWTEYNRRLGTRMRLTRLPEVNGQELVRYRVLAVNSRFRACLYLHFSEDSLLGREFVRFVKLEDRYFYRFLWGRSFLWTEIRFLLRAPGNRSPTGGKNG